MKTTRTARWSTLAVAVAAATGMTAAVAQQFQEVDANLQVIERSLDGTMKKGPMQPLKNIEQQAFQPTRFLIEFVEPAVATYKGGIAGFEATSAKATGEQRLDVNSRKVESYSNYLAKRQDMVMAEVTKRVPEIKERASLSLTFNGVIVEYRGDDLKERLRGVPGIKAVHADSLVYSNMDASNALIGAPAVWEQLGGQANAGKGIKVAVVDSGLAFDHPMFADNGHDPVVVDSEAGADWCVANAEVCGDKVAVARFYDAYTGVSPDEILDSPWDVNGHGTHVAGTAVGNPVSTTVEGIAVNFSGVAPGATLMVYKAMYSNTNGIGSGSGLSLAQALEDAALDGADVINNSWGGGAGGSPVTSYYRPIFEALDEMGVVTVTAAGNDGPGPESVGCPGCIEETITVASTQTGRVFGNQLNVTGFDEPFTSYMGSGDFEVTSPITAELLPASQVDSANIEACTAFEADSFSGKIALVSRGTCSFEEKANILEDAGAVGMVLYNNADGVIVMNMGAATLPGVSILQADGLAIEENWAAGMQATINPNVDGVDKAVEDTMSDFSSRGPNGDSAILKPEIAAPGSDILSAWPGPTYNMISGTSMASPHVAGAAALVLSSYGDVTPQQVKSILMSSATGGIRKEDGETPADAFDVGAGRLDLPAAMNVGVTFDKPSLANNMCVNTCTFTRTATNLSDAAANWQVAVSFDDPNISATFTEALALDAGATGTFEMEVNGSLAGEGWQFGQVTFTDASGTYADAVMPIAIYTALSENSSVISAGVTAGELLAGTDFTMSAVAALGGTGEPVTLSVQYPTDENFVIDEASLTVTEDLSTRTSSTYDAETRSYTWVGTQVKTADVASIGDATASFPYTGYGLGNSGLSFQSICTEGCDETYSTLTLPAGYEWLVGDTAYSTFTVWSNGFVELGERRTSTQYYQGYMPNQDGTDGVVAPLWSDFEFLAGEGEMRYTLVGLGDDVYMILEWHNALSYRDPGQPASDNGERYTFSAWFRLNTNEVYFNYTNVGTQPPFWGSSIGVEDITGTVGATAYYKDAANDIGTYPAANATYGAKIDAGDNGSVKVDLAANVATFGDVAAAAADGSHSRALTVDLTDAVGEPSREFLTMLNASSAELSYDAVLPMHVEPTGALTLEATVAPENGTLSFDGMVATYTPTDGWTGSDSFTYRAVDESGAFSTENTVAIDITNAAPVISVSAPDQVTANESVSLDAGASSDADGDALTYAWTLVSGPEELTVADSDAATLAFTAPELAETADATFSVTVSDGLTSSEQEVTVEILKKKDSSAFGWLFVLLALPLVWLRRRAV